MTAPGQPTPTPEPAPPEPERFRSYLRLLARMQSDGRGPWAMEASDVVQMTLLKAHQARDQFRGATAGEMAAWLRAILARTLADAARAASRAKRDAGPLLSLEAAVEDSALRLAEVLPADQPTPSRVVERAERAAALAEAIEQLPDDQREAVILKHLRGMTVDEVCAATGKSPAAVAGLLRRGLRRLRELLAEAP